MSKITWQPSATIDTLQQRAAMLRTIRTFFYERNILEVETPTLAQATITDPHLHSLQTELSYPGAATTKRYYLQTSPEFHMKRLLAAGSGAIFQLCKAFRNDEAGRLHNPEFTMLEWYRPGFDHHRLMDEMDELLQAVLQCSSAQRITYRDMFKQYLDIDIAVATLLELKNIAKQQLDSISFDDDNKDTWLNLLMSHCIEPQLGQQQPCFVYDYPATQSALAKIRNDDYPIAERFEVYVDGLELANGFHELTDADEQRQRFEKELQQRELQQLPALPIDDYFLQALEAGLPDCTGVALGIDRLLMLHGKYKNLADVISFPSSYA